MDQPCRASRQAFAKLVQLHQAPVRGFLTRLCGDDWHRADDLAQETFWKAYPLGRATSARTPAFTQRLESNVPELAEELNGRFSGYLNSSL